MEPRDLGGWAMLGLYATSAAAGFVATVVLDNLFGPLFGRELENARRGLQQMGAGDLHSFEDVFGEPL
jgi:hypothetical protein